VTQASMKIDLPGVNFEQMAREAIAAHLTEALVGADETVKKIVIAAMAQKVNDKGQRDSYEHYNKTPFVEWMAHDLIRQATLDVLRTKVEALRPVIEKAVEAELKRTAKDAAKALTQSFLATTKHGYGVSVQLGVAFKERD
jgi:hypothetical protein